MRPEIERHLRASLRPLRVSWAIMLAVSLAWAGLGAFASAAVSLSDATALTPLTKGLAALGVLCAVATLWIDRSVITPERMAAVIPVPDLALAQRHILGGHLVLWSLAVLPGILGLAQLLLDGPLWLHLALCALSLGVLALLMPTRARIATRLKAVLR
jgi:hypothetical protein